MEPRIHGWPGRGRTGRFPPCGAELRLRLHEGTLPLSHRPIAAAPGFEPGPTEVTARRATVLHHAAVEERKGFGTLAPARVRRPTWVATRPLQPDSLQVPLHRRRERLSRLSR